MCFFFNCFYLFLSVNLGFKGFRGFVCFLGVLGFCRGLRGFLVLRFSGSGFLGFEDLGV